jgi:hypothetical protein
MPGLSEYCDKARMVVEELFPNLSTEAQFALTWLIADFLASLDAIAADS